MARARRLRTLARGSQATAGRIHANLVSLQASGHLETETAKFAVYLSPTRAHNQPDRLTVKNGNLLVNYVMRLGDRATGLQEIYQRTNGRLLLKSRRLNSNPKSTSSLHRDIYSEASRAHIAEVVARDIAFSGLTSRQDIRDFSDTSQRKSPPGHRFSRLAHP